MPRVQIRTILESPPHINELLSRPCPPFGALMVARAAKKIDEEIKLILEAQKSELEKAGLSEELARVLNESEKQSIVDKFNQDNQVYLNKSIDVSIEPLNLQDLGDSKISPLCILKLNGWFIKTEDSTDGSKT